jgi:hypothetical protein
MLLQLAADNMMNDFDDIFKHHPCLKCACGYRAPWGPHAISLANKSPRLWWLPAQPLVSAKHLAHQNPIQITTHSTVWAPALPLSYKSMAKCPPNNITSSTYKGIPISNLQKSFSHFQEQKKPT